MVIKLNFFKRLFVVSEYPFIKTTQSSTYLNQCKIYSFVLVIKWLISKLFIKICTRKQDKNCTLLNPSVNTKKS